MFTELSLLVHNVKGESEHFVNTTDRLEKLREVKTLQWGELCDLLDIKRSMLHYLRKGERNLSFKALRRLEQAEREAGILPPAPPPHAPPLEHEPGDKKNIQFQEKGNEKGIDREEFGRILAEMKRLTAELERIYKGK